MKFQPRPLRVRQWLVIVTLLSSGFVVAQTEPSLNQVYTTAQAGKLNEAQIMIQQVLVSHPNSGKAHFVRAELYARQGKTELARESLASAEKYSPGLAFAKPEAVQALRTQLSAKANAPVLGSLPKQTAAPATYSAAPPSSSSSSWGLPLLLAGGVMVAGYFVFRKKTPVSYAAQTGYANQNALVGPQSFGANGGGVQPTYPQQGAYPQPGYPQQTGSGLGGRIMGGVATGLAVGAGVVAAEAIGKSLMGGHSAGTGQATNPSANDYPPTAGNQDMGGSNFGMNDSSSWDDGASANGGGGGDWDN